MARLTSTSSLILDEDGNYNGIHLKTILTHTGEPYIERKINEKFGLNHPHHPDLARFSYDMGMAENIAKYHDYVEGDDLKSYFAQLMGWDSNDQQ